LVFGPDDVVPGFAGGPNTGLVPVLGPDGPDEPPGAPVLTPLPVGLDCCCVAALDGGAHG
jgi:hypothetical protein